MREFRSTAAAAAVCAVVGCVVYISSLDCGLCFDDETAIIKNGDLRPSAPWSNLLRNDFWGRSLDSELSHKSYRPLTVATFRLNYMLHELQPLGYHLVNVLLHSAVCYLYVLLCGVVFSEVWPALIAGLLFAVHPIHTEAVAGLVGRAEVLSAIFFISSFLAYTKAVKTTRNEGEGKWVCVCLVLSLCSMLSKEQGITVLGVCLVTDYFIYQKMSLGSTVELLISPFQPKSSVPKQLKNMSRRAVSLITFLTLFMVARLRIMKNAPQFPSSANPAAVHLDPPYRQLHWMYLTAFSNSLLFHPSRLSPEYAGGTIPLITSFADVRNLASIATVTGYAVISVFVLTRAGNDFRKRVGVLALSLLVLPYLPASNLFFPVGFVVAERVLYLPSMGFCMLIAFGAQKLAQNRKNLSSKITNLLLLSLILFSSVKTAVQNRVWLSEKELYTSAIRSYPTNSKMLHNLGTQLEGGIDLNQSKWLMKRSIEADPQYIAAYSDLGLVLTRLNEKQEAEKVLRKAVQLIEAQLKSSNPRVPESNLLAYLRLAALIKTNHTHWSEALELCQSVLEKVPDNFRALREAGYILLQMQRLEEARVYLRQAFELQPAEPNVNFLLGLTEGELGNLKAAEWNIGRAMSLGSESNARVYATELAAILKRKGREREADELLAKFS